MEISGTFLDPGHSCVIFRVKYIKFRKWVTLKTRNLLLSQFFLPQTFHFSFQNILTKGTARFLSNEQKAASLISEPPAQWCSLETGHSLIPPAHCCSEYTQPCQHWPSSFLWVVLWDPGFSEDKTLPLWAWGGVTGWTQIKQRCAFWRLCLCMQTRYPV